MAVFLIAERASMERRSIIGAAAVAIGLMVGAVFSFTQVGAMRAANALWHTAGREAWSCQRVGVASTACLARDMHALERRYVEAMDRLAALYDQVEPHQPVLFGAQPVEGVQGRFVPMETTFTDPVGSWTVYAVSDLELRSGQLVQPDNSPSLDCFQLRSQLAVQITNVLNGKPPEVVAIRQSLGYLAACDE